MNFHAFLDEPDQLYFNSNSGHVYLLWNELRFLPKLVSR